LTAQTGMGYYWRWCRCWQSLISSFPNHTFLLMVDG